MPLGPFESEVLRLLAGNRNPDSYIGGATVLHQAPDSPRASADINVFHDTAPAVHDAAERDTATLQTAGYDVRIVSRQECFCRAIVAKGPVTDKLGGAFRQGRLTMWFDVRQFRDARMIAAAGTANSLLAPAAVI